VDRHRRGGVPRGGRDQSDGVLPRELPRGAGGESTAHGGELRQLHRLRPPRDTPDERVRLALTVLGRPPRGAVMDQAIWTEWKRVEGDGLVFDEIVYEKCTHRKLGGGVARITMNKPTKMN